MGKRKKKKKAEFENTMIKSAFLYGEPNKEKLQVLKQIQTNYTKEVNRFIGVLSKDDTYMLQLLLNGKRSPELRSVEKENRGPLLNAALSQSAFDYAVESLSNRLVDIRNGVYCICPSFLSSSKILFAYCVLGKTREEMIQAFEKIVAGMKKGGKFYKESINELKNMDEKTFQERTSEVRAWYRIISGEHRIPFVKRADVRLVSTLFKLEHSDDIKAPYVISIADPRNKRQRITVPLNTSAKSLHRLENYGAKATLTYTVRADGTLKVSVPFEKKLSTPEGTEYLGVDVGITDMLHTSDGEAIGSFDPVIRFYKEEAEPLLGEISKLHNKKGKLKRYLKNHKNLPPEAKKAIRDKMDRLETMIRRAKKAYRKVNHYYNMLSHEVKKAVDRYLSTLDKNRETVTVLELLDINEFNKSKKANGMLSMFARGLLSLKLIEALNWNGFPFLQVDPAYTSQCCPVCSYTDKENRHGKDFTCLCCGHHDDADHVGAVNIKARAEDTEILEVCEKYPGKTQRHEQIKIVYKKRNQEWKAKQKAKAESIT